MFEFALGFLSTIGLIGGTIYLLKPWLHRPDNFYQGDDDAS